MKPKLPKHIKVSPEWVLRLGNEARRVGERWSAYMEAVSLRNAAPNGSDVFSERLNASERARDEWVTALQSEHAAVEAFWAEHQ